MKTLVFATSNPHKLVEIREMVKESFAIESLADIGWEKELPETHDTLRENAIEKARTIADLLETDCFAEDTGLEVDALDGRPGVFSARYAGEKANPADNISKLLTELDGKKNRKARFRTVIALIMDRATYCFEGTVEGQIALRPSGSGGFGYDPVFIPAGYEDSFGSLDPGIKATISHRAEAAAKLVRFLSSYIKCKSPDDHTAENDAGNTVGGEKCQVDTAEVRRRNNAVLINQCPEENQGSQSAQPAEAIKIMDQEIDHVYADTGTYEVQQRGQ